MSKCIAKYAIVAAALVVSFMPIDSLAQNEEIVVTAMRREANDDTANSIPAVGLRRRGDFLVQRYFLISDTRDPAKRREEVYTTLASLLGEAEKNSNIEISAGDEEELKSVTRTNARAVPLAPNYGGRADTSYVSVFVKHRLAQDGSNAQAAVQAIETFAKKVPLNGRTEILRSGDTQISIVNPQQYRMKILELVAEDAKRVAALLGPDHAADLGGYTRPVEWVGESPTEVFLFIRYTSSIYPNRR